MREPVIGSIKAGLPAVAAALRNLMICGWASMAALAAQAPPPVAADATLPSWLSFAVGLVLLMVVVLGALFLAKPFLRENTAAVEQQLSRKLEAALNLLQKRFDEKLATFDEKLAGFDDQAKAMREELRLGLQNQGANLDEKLSAVALQAVGQQAVEAGRKIEVLGGQLSALETRIEALRQALENATHQLHERDQAFKGLVWPSLFLDGGALAAWRGKIIEKMGREDLQAMGLYLALGQFNRAVKQPEIETAAVASAVHLLSIEAHKLWKADGTDLIETSQEWSQAFQSILDTLETPLDIKPVFAGDRFDMHTMLCSETSLGKRINVKEPLSWIIWEKSPTDAKVLHPGHVTTC